jgi:hypothetical protein
MRAIGEADDRALADALVGDPCDTGSRSRL